MKNAFPLAAMVALPFLAACNSKDTTAPVAPTPAFDTPRGLVVAQTACSPCHGATLQGDRTGAPSLAVVTEYDWYSFDHLLSTGVTHDGRQANAAMSPTRNAGISTADRKALYAYLSTRVW